jgi:DNA-binding transcriptional LysR family regulator
MNWQSVAFDWNHLRAFLASVETGSLSAAARALGTTQPTISRQIAALEKRLGVTLFERSGRSLRLTEAGRELLGDVRTMGEAASHLSMVATAQSQSTEGLVRITANDMYAAYILPAALKRLHNLAPRLTVEIIASNQINDLMRREADIAIRHVPPQQAELIAKRCPDTSANLYAASGYFGGNGRPRTARDLAGASFIGFTGSIDDMVRELNSRGVAVTAQNFKWSTASGIVGWEMLKQGLGLGLMMKEVAAVTPGVEVVLPEFDPIPVPTWLVTHRELHTSRRIRLVFDFLSEMLS